MSHGCPSEVKEMLKEFGDDPFGMTKSFWVTTEDGGRSSATPVYGGTDTNHAGSRSSPLHCR